MFGQITHILADNAHFGGECMCWWILYILVDVLYSGGYLHFGVYCTFWRLLHGLADNVHVGSYCTFWQLLFMLAATVHVDGHCKLKDIPRLLSTMVPGVLQTISN